MNYLFKFENFTTSKDKEEWKISVYNDIRDILIEAEDYGFTIGTVYGIWDNTIRQMVSSASIYCEDLIIGKDSSWLKIKDCMLRIKDYLGDSFKYFNYRVYRKARERGAPFGLNNFYVTEEIKTDLNDSLSIDEPIYSVSIIYKLD